MVSVFDKFPAPSAAQLLGWTLISEQPETGTIEIEFNPDERMLNPHGNVQGGFIAAMLDDTMGPALLSASGGEFVASSIEMKVSFLRPVRPGRVICKGRVLHRGRSVAFLEAELFDADGRICARATSSAIPVRVAR